MFSVKEIIGDMRASVVSMLTTGAILCAASIGGAIWKSVQQQPIPWAVLIAVGLFGFVLSGIAIAKLSGTSKKTNGLKQPSEPQPVIIAVDELKTLLYEGERLVGRFQEDSVKPTFGEVDDWRKRTRDCARQNTLASLVKPKDLLRLEKQWEQGELIRITAKFLDHGCFAYGSVEMAVFEHLWGSVERLKELIAKIESEESTADKEKNGPVSQPSVMPTIPAQDLGYLADPAYDRFWPSSWRNALIERGQRLTEQWATRLDYPEKQRRENDSKNWLCEAGEFAGKHLTSEQMNEFTLHHGTAASASKKYDFGMALIQAGTETGSEDGNLAFEIFGKVKLLERFRSEPMPPS